MQLKSAIDSYPKITAPINGGSAKEEENMSNKKSVETVETTNATVAPQEMAPATESTTVVVEESFGQCLKKTLCAAGRGIKKHAGKIAIGGLVAGLGLAKLISVGKHADDDSYDDEYDSEEESFSSDDGEEVSEY